MSETNQKEPETKKYTLTQSLGAFVPTDRRDYFGLINTVAMLEPVSTAETVLRIALDKHISCGKNGDDINSGAAGAFVQGIALGAVISQHYERKEMQTFVKELYSLGDEATAAVKSSEDKVTQAQQEELSKSMNAIFAGLETLKKFAINQKEASRGKNAN
jgi:hypothetical protein